MLESYVDQSVVVVTNDGRFLVGLLRGVDPTTNVILEHCKERIFSLDEGMVTVELGLYVVRGDSMYVYQLLRSSYSTLIGEMDVEKDEAMNWSMLKVDAIPQLAH